jgi:hypothetical protein
LLSVFSRKRHADIAAGEVDHRRGAAFEQFQRVEDSPMMAPPARTTHLPVAFLIVIWSAIGLPFPVRPWRTPSIVARSRLFAGVP